MAGLSTWAGSRAHRGRARGLVGAGLELFTVDYVRPAGAIVDKRTTSAGQLVAGLGVSSSEQPIRLSSSVCRFCRRLVGSPLLRFRCFFKILRLSARSSLTQRSIVHILCVCTLTRQEDIMLLADYRLSNWSIACLLLKLTTTPIRK